MENSDFGISGQTLSHDEKNTGMWMHLAPLIAIPVNIFIPIPFLPFIVALVLYFTQRSKSEFVKIHGNESLNFQLTLLLISIVLGVVFLIFFGGSILSLITNGSEGNLFSENLYELIGGGIIIGVVGIVVFIVMIVFMITASVKANQGLIYRYPISIRFVK